MKDPFSEYLEAMQAGLIPTKREFVCPLCNGSAYVQASTHIRESGYLSLSAWCDNCGVAIEEDGVLEWPGWESIHVSNSPEDTEGAKSSDK